MLKLMMVAATAANSYLDVSSEYINDMIQHAQHMKNHYLPGLTFFDKCKAHDVQADFEPEKYGGMWYHHSVNKAFEKKYGATICHTQMWSWRPRLNTMFEVTNSWQTYDKADDVTDREIYSSFAKFTNDDLSEPRLKGKL